MGRRFRLKTVKVFYFESRSCISRIMIGFMFDLFYFVLVCILNKQCQHIAILIYCGFGVVFLNGDAITKKAVLRCVNIE
jgi:hypothetical protein